MNKVLQKQVDYQGKQLEAIFNRLHKIEDKVMREEYEIRVTCPNCARSHYLTIPIGEKRPVKCVCEYCRCEVEPKSVSW